MAEEDGFVDEPPDTPTRPGLPVRSAPYPMVRLVRKASTLSSQLHSPLHQGGSILTSPKPTRRARATSPEKAGSPKQDPLDSGPTCLRRTGSGDVIIGEVVLMRPRRALRASGEGASDMVQVELDSVRESPPPRNGRSDEEVPLSWIKRGTTAGKVAAIVFVTILWLMLVAGASTYYFIETELNDTSPRQGAARLLSNGLEAIYNATHHH